MVCDIEPALKGLARAAVEVALVAAGSEGAAVARGMLEEGCPTLDVLVIDATVAQVLAVLVQLDSFAGCQPVFRAGTTGSYELTPTQCIKDTGAVFERPQP